MSKREAFWSSLACLFIGIAVGFLLSPVKRGVYCGRSSGNNNGDRHIAPNECGDFFDDDYYDDEDDEDDMPF